MASAAAADLSILLRRSEQVDEMNKEDEDGRLPKRPDSGPRLRGWSALIRRRGKRRLPSELLLGSHEGAAPRRLYASGTAPYRPKLHHADTLRDPRTHHSHLYSGRDLWTGPLDGTAAGLRDGRPPPRSPEQKRLRSVIPKSRRSSSRGAAVLLRPTRLRKASLSRPVILTLHFCSFLL
ncbi:hypothetical protein FQA47_018277 [Oryzias melastigma]|uniref:Uncharacterized protein n=1 Tax=Oryzias melastigma TaxID=30732 RepID=A0A834FS26_ORYME|nr:hypothetical protein FQA47_018277 [Oryzias melastigma]